MMTDYDRNYNVFSRAHTLRFSPKHRFSILCVCIGRLGRSSCMSIWCWQMVPGWDRELGRGLRSEKQAWRLHPGHQTARLDPGNHVNIADCGTAIVRQQTQLKRSNSLNIYSAWLSCTSFGQNSLWNCSKLRDTDLNHCGCMHLGLNMAKMVCTHFYTGTCIILVHTVHSTKWMINWKCHVIRSPTHGFCFDAVVSICWTVRFTSPLLFGNNAVIFVNCIVLKTVLDLPNILCLFLKTSLADVGTSSNPKPFFLLRWKASLQSRNLCKHPTCVDLFSSSVWSWDLSAETPKWRIR